jgi:hypothetical protein
VSVYFTSLFFSIYALYGEAVVILAEPGLKDLASFVPCFEIEGRLAALTVLPVEAVGVAEVMLVHERRQWENQVTM